MKSPLSAKAGISLRPATRSALIIGGLFFVFIVNAMFWVGKKALEIRRDRDATLLASSGAAGDMVLIPAGKFTMGSNDGQTDEKPLHDVKVDAFWMDKTEVTNAQFARFVQETGYVTLAERPIDPKQFPGVPPEQLKPGAITFTPPPRVETLDDHMQWWSYTPGANWRHPEGPKSHIDGREKFPVVQVCWEDAVAYAKWAGKRLPTEAEWEYAARGGLVHNPFIWGREKVPGGKWMANIWQGSFPNENTGEDGFKAVAPVGSYTPNGYGLHDMAGNVWEWCADWYLPNYYEKSPRTNPPGPDTSFDPNEPGVMKRVTRGGSFMCSDMYCRGYRPSARMKTSPDTALAHTGFRCVKSGERR